MAEKLFMTALSPTMSEGTIARWKVAEGEAFKAGALLCEVETDKAAMDYEAPKAGTLLKILLPVGGKAQVGEVIAIVGAQGEDPGPLIASLGLTAKAPAKPTEASASFAPAVPSAEAGVAAQVATLPAASGGPFLPTGIPPSSPLARARARERGIDIRAIRGSGPGGRIVRRDVDAYVPNVPALPSATVGTAAALHGARRGVPENRSVAVSGKRAVIARRLSESFFAAPHFYIKKRVLADRLIGLRAALNQGREKALSFNAFLIKLSSEAIKRHPYVNSTWLGRTIEEHASIDIGLAVALPDGLITPVVRDCGSKGLAEIDAELSALIEKAKSRGLAPDEYEGATFTISNLGSYGVDEFTAIINPPGSAILAVGAARKEAVVLEDDSIAPRRVMDLNLGCDHRVIDGAAGAEFLRTLAGFLEEPGRTLA